MQKRPQYPFVPKSTAFLMPGDFWEIPLKDGGFACGRVMQLFIEKGNRDTRGFLAGLMDWFGEELPTAKSLAGKKIIDQGDVHVKTVRETGGMIRGNRPLPLDGLGPWVFRDAELADYIQCGLYRLRRYDPEIDADLPVHSAWGYCHIKDVAEYRFRKRKRRKR